MFALVLPGAPLGRFAKGLLHDSRLRGTASLAEATGALDDAEETYRQAIAELEREYVTVHHRMPKDTATRLDATLEEARTEMSEARSQAGHSLEARLRLLDGYAEYLFALQTIVHEEVR
jgi:F0F1-type ATP synthase membrane subunit b/b'